jgi:6-phosphogluconolactonase
VNVDPSLDVQAAAEDYAVKLTQLANDDPLPAFDVLLLGMGPDGHTCSLFPGHKLLEEESVIVAPISDSPKPPTNRVTLTFPVINNAKACIFVCTGDGKKEIVAKILDEGVDYPAGRVRPAKGELVWILDEPAAALCKKAKL